MSATDATGGTPAFSAANLPAGLRWAAAAKSPARSRPRRLLRGRGHGHRRTYSASQDVVWSVAPAVTITDPGPKSDTEGDAVSLSITAGDTTGATPTFTESGLPPGLNISSGGQITGTVSCRCRPWPYATITATDGTYSASQTLRWDVAPARPARGPATSPPSTPTSPTSAGMAGGLRRSDRSGESRQFGSQRPVRPAGPRRRRQPSSRSLRPSWAGAARQQDPGGNAARRNSRGDAETRKPIESGGQTVVSQATGRNSR